MTHLQSTPPLQGGVSIYVPNPSSIWQKIGGWIGEHAGEIATGALAIGGALTSAFGQTGRQSSPTPRQNIPQVIPTRITAISPLGGVPNMAQAINTASLARARQEFLHPASSAPLLRPYRVFPPIVRPESSDINIQESFPQRLTGSAMLGFPVQFPKSDPSNQVKSATTSIKPSQKHRPYSPKKKHFADWNKVHPLGLPTSPAMQRLSETPAQWHARKMAELKANAKQRRAAIKANPQAQARKWQQAGELMARLQQAEQAQRQTGQAKQRAELKQGKLYQTLLRLRQNQEAANKHNANTQANTAYEFLTHSHPRYHPSPTHTERQVLHLPGIKNYKFPTSPNLPRSAYPDITQNQQIYVRHIVGEIRSGKVTLAEAAVNFRTNGIWDLKGQPGVPPPGHWAIYKGELVTDAYLANNAYGHACAELGLPLKEALLWAERFTKASYYVNYPRQKYFHDQPEDQDAIKSSYHEFLTGNPWPFFLKKPVDYNRK